MKKTIIKIRYRWEYFFGPIVAFIGLLILVILLAKKQLDGNTVAFQETFAIVGCVLFFICGVIATIVSFQTAEVSEEGILFKNLFRKIHFLPWNEIKKIQIEDIKNLSTQGIIHETKWICVYYDQVQSCQKMSNNLRKTKCRHICPTPKNISVLRYYIHKYAFTSDQTRNDMLDIW